MRGIVVGGLFALLCCTIGCVDRRYVVTSNAPQAQVTIDGQHLGPAPLDASYVYTGKRKFHVYAPGYEPRTEDVKFEPKWFDYPGLDLFAEVFWPFRIEDVRRVHVELEPAQPVNVPVIQANAANLRARASTLPPSSVPDDQDTPPQPKAADPMRRALAPTGSTPIPPISPGRFNGR
jgi:PEGA domain